MSMEEIKKRLRDLKPHELGLTTIKETILWLLIANGFLYFLELNDVVFAFVAVISILFMLWLIFSLRNPERNILKDKKSIIAVGDGVIKKVTQVEEGVLVSLYTSPFDVQLQRMPVDASVKSLDYKPGKYRFSWKQNKAGDIEKLSAVLRSGEGHDICVNINSGPLEKSIVHKAEEGKNFSQGDVFGFIKLFGSTTEILIPSNWEVLVKKGDRTRAGETVLARLS